MKNKKRQINVILYQVYTRLMILVPKKLNDKNTKRQPSIINLVYTWSLVVIDGKKLNDKRPNDDEQVRTVGRDHGVRNRGEQIAFVLVPLVQDIGTGLDPLSRRLGSEAAKKQATAQRRTAHAQTRGYNLIGNVLVSPPLGLCATYLEWGWGDNLELCSWVLQ